MAGYDEDFLKVVKLPLPAFSPRIDGFVLRRPELKDGVYANYVNYTIVTNQSSRSPIYAALNIDQNKLKQTDRTDYWRIDSRVGAEFQLDNEYYRDNPWERGHLASRANASWGDTQHQAQKASNETFYYSNSTLQHQNFNGDEWLALEDWVYKLGLDKDGRITSFSGPVYGEFCRSISPNDVESAKIPSAFFKVICFINKDTGKLDVRAFIMLQDKESIKDRSGRSLFNFQNYQVTVTEIERLTDLDFDDEVYEKNPLYFHENEEKARELNISHFPERIEVDSSEEIIDGNKKRDYFGDDEIYVYIAAAMVNPKGKERENEWISIINLSGEEVDLNGWTLTDTMRSPLDIGKVVAAGRRKLKPGEAVSVLPIKPLMLANSGGIIALYAPPENGEEKGKRVDRVKYSEKEAKKEGVPVIFNFRAPE